MSSGQRKERSKLMGFFGNAGNPGMGTGLPAAPGND